MEKVQVTIKSGPIEGVRKTSRLDTPYISFQRVPYAKPPLGKLRFKDPEPADPWTDVLDCTEEGPRSTQCKGDIPESLMGEEDCLYINVYTKDIQPEKSYPVMVFIHGGAFRSGSAGMDRHAPDFLLQRDVILVTFHYRLGALGFLSIGDPSVEVPGNAGLKDQTLALKWVKANIEFFGGDPNNITLFGHSSGGASVHFHMTSNTSKNLFHRAIVQSASILSEWVVIDDPNRALKLAKALGWDDSQGTTQDMLEFLQQQDHLKIAETAATKILSPEEKMKNSFAFGPVIEPYKSKQCFIPVHPTDMTRRAWSRSIPMMIGGSSEEGLLMHRATANNPKILALLNSNWDKILPDGLKSNRDLCVQKLKDLYFNGHDLTEETIFEYLKLLGDKFFWHPIHRAILSRTNSLERGPTWVYRFSYDSANFNHYRRSMCGNDEVRGACHGDELSYLFADTMFGTEVPDTTSADFKMIQTMVELWTNFAISGDPNKPGSMQTNGIKWDPVPDKRLPYKVLNINEQLELISLPEAKRIEFWDSLYENDELY